MRGRRYLPVAGILAPGAIAHGGIIAELANSAIIFSRVGNGRQWLIFLQAASTVVQRVVAK
jgi:hypothetical protein